MIYTKKEIIDKVITDKGKLNTNTIKMYNNDINLQNSIYNHTKFLNEINPTLYQRIWHIVNNIDIIQKCNGNNILLFSNRFKKGYYKTCNITNCICKKNSYIIRKNTLTKKHGKDYELLFKEKRELTNLKRYGVKNAFQSEEKKNKIKETILERYGVEHVMYSPVFKEKIKETNLERYGVEYSLQNKDVRNKLKKTNIEKYGVDNPFKSEIVKNKIKEDNIRKYGVEYQTSRG